MGYGVVLGLVHRCEHGYLFKQWHSACDSVDMALRPMGKDHVPRHPYFERPDITVIVQAKGTISRELNSQRGF